MKLLAKIACLSLVSTWAIAEIPLEHFSKPIEYHNAVISPKGDYIAIQREAEEGKQLVAIVDTETLSLLSHIPATTGSSPIQPRWVSDEKLLVTFTESIRGKEYERHNGELMTMNANGKKKRNILLPQLFVASGDAEKRLNSLHGWAEFAHLLPKEKDHILIKLYEYKHSKIGVKPKLYKIHTTRGKVEFIAEAPTYNADFTFSPDGTPLFSLGVEKDSVKSTNKWVIHKLENNNWSRLGELDLHYDEMHILAATEQPNEIFINARFEETPDKIYRYNLETGAKKLVFFHKTVDPSSFDYDAKTGELVVAHFEDGYPNLHLIKPDHLYAKWYPALYQVFKGKRVEITSNTNDGSLLVLHVSGADEPGQFHLFNTRTKKLRYLFNAASWIKPEQLAQSQPIAFEASDGRTIHGFLTQPKKDTAKSALVVLVHGGPHSRDYWDYDYETQFLASLGYSVLQINFRGSTGYGLGFQEASQLAWGTRVQHDIIEGTKWAAAQSNIDANRICIMGASFGGYSALMAPTIAPDLYKCAIGHVGVYDLNLMWSTGDIKRQQVGKNYLREEIGEDVSIMNQQSPINHVDSLKAPVLLVHGKKDYRVDFKHFSKMKQALEAKDHPHETLIFKKEGHGTADESNRKEYLTRVKGFLAKHL